MPSRFTSPQLPIPGQGTRNVVFVASEHDSVYAFDADGVAPTSLWQKSFIDPANGITTVDTVNDIHCGNLVPEIGITGTPVISLENQALYVVSEVKDQNTGSLHYRAARTRTRDRSREGWQPGSISASVAGTGAGNDGHGNVPFVARLANQRPALLLANGMVYIAFASNCDEGPYHGWLLAYDARHAHAKGGFQPHAHGNAGGIWQSGNGPRPASSAESLSGSVTVHSTARPITATVL